MPLTRLDRPGIEWNRAIRALVAQALLLCACLAPAHAQPPPSRYSNTEIIVKLRPGNSFLHAPPGAIKSRSPSLDARLNRAAAFEAIPVFTAEGADPTLRAALGMDRFYVVRLRKPADIPAMAAELSRHPDVELAEPSYGGTGQGAVAAQSVIPNDTYFDRQWAFRNTGSNAGGFPALAGADIKATDAWSISTGDSSVIVAVLDSGLKYDHPDIADRIWTNPGEIPSNTLDDDGNGFIDDVHGWNFAYQDDEVRDDLGHGTNVSSILGATANNGLGYAGLDWSCRIMTLKVLNSSNFGFFIWWAAALQYAADNGARVVNMSLGGVDISAVLETAVRYAHGRGCFIAAAMGNAGAAVPVFIPAAYSAEVVAVGATGARDTRSSFSSYGDHIDVVAPGELIYGLSHLSDTDYDRAFFGTSMATPMVAGLAALLLAKDPSLGPDEIRDIIRATADDQVGAPLEDTPGFDVYHGFGRINCYRALALDHVPHAPVITVPAEVNGSEGALISIDVSVADPNGDPIQTLTADLGPLPPGHNAAFSRSADNTAGVLTWTPTLNDAGNYSITFTASDVLPGSATTRITIANVNQSPAIAAPSAIGGEETVSIQFDVEATDPDHDDVVFEATGVPGGARFVDNLNNTGTFLWLPAFGQAGSYLVLFSASDGHGGSGTASTLIEVARGDRPPTLAAPGGAGGDEGTAVSFEVTATDPDGEAIASLVADLSGLPLGHGAAFVVHDPGAQGTFSWTPGFDHAGSYPAIFTASNAATTSATTLITIQDVDRPPAVTAPDAVAGAENAPLTIPVAAADPDGDPIQSLAADPLPPGATFEGGMGNSSGILRWTPDFTQAGAYAVTISARSASRAQPVSAPLAEGSATIQFEIANVDRPPIVTAPSSVVATEDALLELTVGAADPDGEGVESLTADLASFPVGHDATFVQGPDLSSGLLRWTPTFSDARSAPYEVIFSAVAHGLTASATTAIAVANRDRAPTADAGGPYFGVANAFVSFDGGGSSDPDGDPLELSWSYGDGTGGSGTTPSHGYAAAGDYLVILEADDGALADRDSTSALIAGTLPAEAFLPGGHKTLSLATGTATTCLQLEPSGGSYNNSDVDFSTLVLISEGTGVVSQIGAVTGKRTVEDDRDRDGVAEITLCFRRDDLRRLFSSVTGRVTLMVAVEGNLRSGARIHAELEVAVVGSGSAVSVTPNPLTSGGTLTWVSARSGFVRVRLFDSRGRLLRTLMEDPRAAAGYHDMTFDGRGADGMRLASGIYFIQVETPEGAAVGRVALLK